jgi:hypothetical protein
VNFLHAGFPEVLARPKCGWTFFFRVLTPSCGSLKRNPCPEAHGIPLDLSSARAAKASRKIDRGPVEVALKGPQRRLLEELRRWT